MSEIESSRKALCLVREMSRWFENEIGLIWDYGLPIQLGRLSLWSTEFDNRFRLAETLDSTNPLKILESCPDMKTLTEHLQTQEGATEQMVMFCRHSLKVLISEPPHADPLGAMHAMLSDPQNIFIPRPIQMNLEPRLSIPLHEELRIRLNNPELSYRLKQGRKPDGSGSMLATVSQWLPDLEALCSLNHYILTHNLPLMDGKSSLKEIVPIGGRKPAVIKTLDDWRQHILIPARKFRYPQVQNPSIAVVLDRALAIDFEALSETPKICSNLRNHLETISKEELKHHLFILPEKVLPDNNESSFLPDKLMAHRIQRRKSPASGVKNATFNNKLLDMIKSIHSSVSNLKIEDMEKSYRQLQNRYQELVSSLKNWLSQPPKQKRQTTAEGPRLSTPNSLKSPALRKPPVPFKGERDTVMDDIQKRIPPFEEREADLLVLQELLGGRFWQENPEDASKLCSRIFFLFRELRNQPAEEPDFLASFKSAAQSKDCSAIEPVLKACQARVSSLPAALLKELAEWTRKSPDVREAFYEAYCSHQATKVIQSYKLDQLPQESRQKLSRLVNQQHVLQIAEKGMGDFLLKDPPLSREEKRRLGSISVSIMLQMSQFLEKESDNQEAAILLRRIKVLMSQYSDDFFQKTEDSSVEFSQACQDWLHSICHYLYEQDSRLYYAVARETESLFVTVWKKVEQQLQNP